jgi:hypothetical protein
MSSEHNHRRCSSDDPKANRAAMRQGTGTEDCLFCDQEVPMIKALLTPVLLGLGVAVLIRMASARRAY